MTVINPRSDQSSARGKSNHLTLKMTSAQVVETSVNVISNSPSQDYTHPDDRTLLYDYYYRYWCFSYCNQCFHFFYFSINMERVLYYVMTIRSSDFRLG